MHQSNTLKAFPFLKIVAAFCLLAAALAPVVLPMESDSVGDDAAVKRVEAESGEAALRP